MGQRRALLWIAAAAAATWRLFLAGRYFGWEESDYGNLAMVRGVLEGGFAHYDMNHLPLYYALSAVVMAVLDDAVLSARLVSMAGGVATVVLGATLADRLHGRRVAWTVALLLAFQPELALYSSSSLREPLYAALLLGALVALTSERMALAGVLTGFAFLTRMDALLTFGPVLMLHAMGETGRVRRLLAALGPLFGMVLLWSVYCGYEHGTYAFWEHSVAVNVETGGGGEQGLNSAWWMGGFGVSWQLFTDVLAQRMGWLPWLGFVAGLCFAPLLRHGPRRTVWAAAASMLGFWLGIGFVAQHEPGHNLYWKWLHAVLPFLFLVGVPMLWQALDGLRRLLGNAGAVVVNLVLAGIVGATFGQETHRQVRLSAELYGPQLELGRWIEEQTPADSVLLVDNIPGAWLNRRPHGRVLWTWFDVLECPDCTLTESQFGEWLLGEGISHVLWFREEWTQAPRVAPWLDGTQTVGLGPVSVVPLREEPDYGWVFYKVDANGTD